MLHAVSQKKPGCTKRLGRDEKHQKTYKGNGQEDSITSSFFGPLDFMPAAESWEFWKQVINRSIGTSIPDTSPFSAQYRFWPKLKSGDDIGYCEPDILIEYCWLNEQAEEKNIIILVEIKWDSNFSNAEGFASQLHRQWHELKQSNREQNAVHVFIGKKTSEALQAKELQDDWGDKLIIWSWKNIRSILNSNTATNSNLYDKWSRISSSFLENLNIIEFSGISSFRESMDEGDLILRINELNSNANSNGVIFYAPFVGFCKIISDLNDLKLDAKYTFSIQDGENE